LPDTGETVYTPPAVEDELKKLLSNLEKYINEDYNDIDPYQKYIQKS